MKTIITILMLLSISVGAVEKVLCFGDSITQARGKTVKGMISWSEMFEKFSDGKVTGINAGRGGRRITQFTDLTKYKQLPDCSKLVVFLGVNDLKHSSEKTLRRCMASVKEIIKIARAAQPKIKIYFCSSIGLSFETLKPEIKKYGYDENCQIYLDKFSVKLSGFCKKEKIGFIDLKGVVSSENYKDGLHPNQAGQTQIAQAVWKHIQ